MYENHQFIVLHNIKSMNYLSISWKSPSLMHHTIPTLYCNTLNINAYSYYYQLVVQLFC